MKSLAMPALSVGQLEYPPADATLVMLKSINDFFSELHEKRHPSCLRHVHLVDISDSIVNHFYESAVKTFGKTIILRRPPGASGQESMYAVDILFLYFTCCYALILLIGYCVIVSIRCLACKLRSLDHFLRHNFHDSVSRLIDINTCHFFWPCNIFSLLELLPPVCFLN